MICVLEAVLQQEGVPVDTPLAESLLDHFKKSVQDSLDHFGPPLAIAGDRVRYEVQYAMGFREGLSLTIYGRYEKPMVRFNRMPYVTCTPESAVFAADKEWKQGQEQPLYVLFSLVRGEVWDKDEGNKRIYECAVGVFAGIGKEASAFFYLLPQTEDAS